MCESNILSLCVRVFFSFNYYLPLVRQKAYTVYIVLVYLQIVAPVTSAHGCLLCLDTINHVNQVNVRVSLPNRTITIRSLHTIVILIGVGK